MTAELVIAAAALAAWVYLMFLRGFFWLPRELPRAAAPDAWPSVVAIVPARDEAATIGAAIGSLLAKDYRGEFGIVLVDDHSSDGTARLAREAAEEAGAANRVAIVEAGALPRGWTGKLWALSEGVHALEAAGAAPDLLLFTDADIAHAPDNLSSLVVALEDRRRDLVSLMVKLRCKDWAERLLVPAFVFFFAMIYPFAWVNDRTKRTAAAAGGCVLMRREIYHRIGGLGPIRDALIDDCALARAVKEKGGAIHLAMTHGTRSLRPYPRVADIWAMVARTAYTQLDHSPLLLAGTVLFLAAAYIAPPLLLFSGERTAALGLGAWLLMAFAYVPMLTFYRCSLAFAPLLPLVGAVYVGATLNSARRYYAGKGGAWKGRVQWQSPP